MTDSEILLQEENIEKAMLMLEELQQEYIKETGSRYVAPVRLTYPKL